VAVAVVLFLVGVRMFDGMGEMKATQTTPFGYIADELETEKEKDLFEWMDGEMDGVVEVKCVQRR
jgi:hypothetical protein